jgi:exopolyphosphatase/pppGpp-phosphohydrolase
MDMPVPPGWSSEDWNLLGWTVRYHRGGEPKMEGSKFSELTGPQQEIIRGLAGVLRLARVLQKTGITTATGMKMENSQEAVVVLVPNLADSVEAAAKLAAGKHLLETAIGKPVFLRKPVVPSKVIALPSPVQHTVPNVAMAASSD